MTDENKEDLQRLFQAGIDAGRSDIEFETETSSHPTINNVTLNGHLGEGGMGTVYHGIHHTFGVEVAIKMLRSGSGAIESQRLLRESQALAQLDHPHIMDIYAISETEAGTPYLILEYVTGGDLARRLRTGHIPVEEALHILRQVIEALGYAHQQGIIHRDLKPSNILFDEKGDVRVADFGLAKFYLEDSMTTLTMSGTTVGTIDYMAPEQKQVHGVINQQSDIYALGVLLYEMISRKRPQGVFPSLESLGFDPHLDAVVNRCLAHEPDDRYPSCEALLDDLNTLHTASTIKTRGRIWMLAVGALAICTLLAIGLLLLNQRSSPPDPHVEAMAAEGLLIGEWENLAPALRSQDSRANTRGDWSWRGNQLSITADPNNPAAIHAIDIDPGDYYDFRIQFVRTEGADSIPLFFTTRSGRASFEVDAWQSGLAGIQSINGQDLRASDKSFRTQHTNGETESLMVSVREFVVKVFHNDQLRASIPLHDAQLTIVPIWEYNSDAPLGIGAWDSTVHFESIQLRRLTPAP